MNNIVKVQDYFKVNIERIQNACQSVVMDEQVMDAVQVIAKNPKLQSCNSSSIVGAVITASRLGVSLDPNIKHSYLIPYGKECKLEISYMGLIDVIYRATGGLIEAHMVYQNDGFDYQQGSEPKITHSPMVFGDKGNLLGCYAICTIDDKLSIEFMDYDEIEKCKAESKGGQVWNKWYNEMAKKSVIRRLYKRLPKTRQSALVASYDERVAIGADTSDIVNIDGVELPEKDFSAEQELDALTGGE
jgi:recombination protein RecT